MAEHRYPSPVFPGPPAVSVDVPEGWRPESTGSGLMAFADPAETEGFRTNIVVSAVRIPAGMTLDEAAERARLTSAQTLADYQVVDQQKASLAGAPALVRTQHFRLGPGGPPIFQVTVMTLAPPTGEAVGHLIRVEGTCGMDALEDFQPVFRGVARSLRFRPSG